MTLATAMKDSKLVSDRYIYEYIFNMSEDQWLQERTDVVEDLKLRFRQNQIEQEGNDPSITGVSFGTPHDMASLHMSSKEVEDKDLGGRPPEGIKFGQHKNQMGWDPTGAKELKQSFNPENQKTAFQPDPKFKNLAGSVAVENRNMLKHLKSKNKSINIITESLNSKKKQDSNLDDGTMLDENNIL